MSKSGDNFKNKGLYIMLAAGVIAVSGLMIRYNYKNAKEEILQEQAIDLNQPVVGENEIDFQFDTEEYAAEVSDVDSNAVVPGKNDNQNKTTDQTKNSIATDKNTEAPSTSESEETDKLAQTAAETVYAPNFNAEQTLLWPVNGVVILPYSMDTTVYFKTLNSYRCNSGMLIESEVGAPVFAAYEGIVKNIEESSEFGKMITIDMGNGYEAVYGQLMNPVVEVGDKIAVNQKLAETAEPTSYYTEEGSHLYFAIRHNGEAVDPMTFME